MAGRRLAALVVAVSVAPVDVAGMVAPVPLGMAVASPDVVRPYTLVAEVAPAPVAV